MGCGRPKMGQYTHERLIYLCFLTRLHRKKTGYQFDQRRTYNSAVFENLMPHRTHSKIGGTREPNAAEPIPISGFREPNASERYLPRFTRRSCAWGCGHYTVLRQNAVTCTLQSPPHSPGGVGNTTPPGVCGLKQQHLRCITLKRGV